MSKREREALERIWNSRAGCMSPNTLTGWQPYDAGFRKWRPAFVPLYGEEVEPEPPKTGDRIDIGKRQKGFIQKVTVEAARVPKPFTGTLDMAKIREGFRSPRKWASERYEDDYGNVSYRVVHAKYALRRMRENALRDQFVARAMHDLEVAE